MKSDAAGASPGPAIEVTGLRKAYAGLGALRGIAFEVARGEVYGLLGPNGAGKTTTVEILEGYRARSAGSVSVLGLDPGDRPGALRERVGIVLQSCGFYPHLTVREAIEHWASLYPAPREPAEVVGLVGLEEAADRRTRVLSGGQRRRPDLAPALVGDPELVFLDEPTTGFDPSARRAAWDTIRSLRDLGKTILLTTHYIEEAQQLADRVAVLAKGEIVASGTPADLISAASATEIRYRRDGEVVVVETEDPTRVLHELTGEALRAGVPLAELEVRRPTLEDIYLTLTEEG